MLSYEKSDYSFVNSFKEKYLILYGIEKKIEWDLCMIVYYEIAT